MRPEEWIIRGNTGTSSQTIWAVMMGVVTNANRDSFHWGAFDVPHDPSDFGRCHALLETVPGWRGRLQEVADIFPEWQPMVSQWDRMTRLFCREKPTGSCPDLFQLMQLLRDEGRALVGWKENSPGHWTAKFEKGSAYYGRIQ